MLPAPGRCRGDGSVFHLSGGWNKTREIRDDLCRLSEPPTPTAPPSAGGRHVVLPLSLIRGEKFTGTGGAVERIPLAGLPEDGPPQEGKANQGWNQHEASSSWLLNT